ncbi:hypothetical protein [Streptomyces sp. NPDC017993]|uniref:hypothetical protein n=1 Tax=Streptomyces sp. NPDC017993 TaxID=3365027 RepID=UPI00379E5FEE
MPEPHSPLPTEPVDLPSARSGQPSAARANLDFTPLRNGMDYLRSAVRHLAGPEWEYKDGEPDARALKYAVLHLHAATEVLLKARLIHEHWSLVFPDPASATWATYTGGGFRSCSVDTALDRLEKIARVNVEQKHRTTIGNLGNTRNALIHYGHTESARAVEGQVAEVLHILLVFIDQHLRPDDPEEAAHVHAALEELRGRLGSIRKLVDKRMKRLTPQLREHAASRTDCPECRQRALVVGQSPTCLYCGKRYDTPQAAALRWCEARDGGAPEEYRSWSVADCSVCQAPDSRVVDEDMQQCFACPAGTF